MITTKEGVDTTQLTEFLALFSYKSLRKNYCPLYVISIYIYDLIDPILLLQTIHENHAFSDTIIIKSQKSIRAYRYRKNKHLM